MTTDMTKGSPSKLLLKFAIPMLFSVIFQQLYNIADSIIAGNFINKEALAAVGVSYPITMIFIAVGTGANIGCTVVISQFFGAKEYSKMKTAVFTSLFSVIGLGTVLTATGLVINPLLMKLLDTPENIFADAELYLNIYIWGLTFLFLYNICTGIFTALGDSTTPLVFLILSSVSNVAMDYVFVAYFKQTGLRLSTGLSAFIISFRILFHAYIDKAASFNFYVCMRGLLPALYSPFRSLLISN